MLYASWSQLIVFANFEQIQFDEAASCLTVCSVSVGYWNPCTLYSFGVMVAEHRDVHWVCPFVHVICWWGIVSPVPYPAGLVSCLCHVVWRHIHSTDIHAGRESDCSIVRSYLSASYERLWSQKLSTFLLKL